MSFSLLSYRNAVSRNLETDERITKEAFELFISAVASLCGLVQGFLITQSDLLIESGALLKYEPKLAERELFQDHFRTLFYAGEMIGALGCFVFADEFGRKTTLTNSSLLCALTILWYAISGSAEYLLTARFFVGVFLGAMMTVCPVYVAEIATPGSRGQCVGLLVLNMVVGSLLAVLGFYLLQDYAVGWRLSLLFPVLVQVCGAVVLFFLPASPRWMLAQRTPAKCLQAMRQLRRTKDVSKEFNEAYRALTSDAKLGHDWADLFTTKSILLRLLVVGVLEVAHLFVGTQLISVFGQQLFSDFGDQSAVLGLLLVLLAQLLGTGVFLMNIDALGRRTLLLSGSGLMGLAWLCAAICVYIASLPQEQRLFDSTDEKSHYWAVLSVYLTQFFFGCALCVYAFAFALSLGSVKWVFTSEVFPYRTRAKAASAVMAAYFCSDMFTASLYTLSITDIGIWGAFNNPTQPAAGIPTAGTGGGSGDGAGTALWSTLPSDIANALVGLLASPAADAGWWNTEQGDPTHRLLRHHHKHHQYHPIPDPPPVHTVVIKADYSATEFLLKLALVSLALGLFVYLYVPETKDLRLELMDELFRVDTASSACCNCCPDMRHHGLLGLRTLTEQQKGTFRSAQKPIPKAPSRSGLQPQTSSSSSSVAGDNTWMSRDEAEGADFEEIVPSSLHKYSAEMHGSKFNYITEDEPLIPSFDLNI